MEPYFLYNGIDSRNKGLWVKELPAPTRAEERVDVIEIPGRAGHVTIKEGENIHKSYLRECIVQAPATADFNAILSWLSGSGPVVFSNEDNRVYFAEITAEVRFDKISNSLKEATIPFYVQPHKGKYPTESNVVINGTSGSITNPGDVASSPIVVIEVTGGGSIQINIGNSAMAFSSAPSYLRVDCGAGIVTTNNGSLWQGVYSGDFFSIGPGANTVTLSSSAKLTITPRWRWK